MVQTEFSENCPAPLLAVIKRVEKKQPIIYQKVSDWARGVKILRPGQSNYIKIEKPVKS